ncbi:killer cell lectin-like receptor subfamily G member 1 isoform X3 [Chroicocephalus ridibundus]|uniref:killer cell lectin-like receptor subfamily G member 1 isoform X3 n=1 Tax=Chroicocephalus ridibundus TaxID=1192867 RepID=UPI002FDCC3B5
MTPSCWEESSIDLQGNSNPGLDFVTNCTFKFQIKKSEKRQNLKACDGNTNEHIYLNVKYSPSSKKQKMRRQSTEENQNTKSKGCRNPPCPEQWVAYRGSCYSFSKEKKDWHSSQQSCSEQGAHLLVISDTREMDLFKSIQTECFWIGLRNSTGSVWIWEDGSIFNGTKITSNSPVQHCAVLIKGHFQASSCEYAAPWICEKSLR